MKATRTLPPTASVADIQEDGRLFAESAARNQQPICDILKDIAPPKGHALEIAAGTGQHSPAFAKTCPGLIWVPTDIDEARLASIRAYVMDAQLPNLSLPLPLDATQSGWSKTTGPLDLVVLVNLLHLISEAEARMILAEVSNALTPNGQFLLYGPFMRGGELTSAGDESFHQSLVNADPEIGYKDDFDIIDWAGEYGLSPRHVLEMPANNLAFVFSRSEV